MNNKDLVYEDLKVTDVTTNQLTSTHMGMVEEKQNIDLEGLKKEIMAELVKYGTIFGEINYRLAKILYEKTKSLSFTDTHRVYAYVTDYLGISLQTIKNLVHVYKKLEKFNLWHNETGLFKLRLFQLAYYIMKKTSEPDLVLNKAYYEIVNDFKLRVWFEKASYKEVIEWFKERFDTYLRVFRPKATFSAICDICHTNLRPEEFNKTWSYLPICFNCYDLIKEENKEKIHMLKHAISKKLAETEVEELKNMVNNLRTELVQQINKYDKIRLERSRKYKKIMDNIQKVIL